MHHTKSPPMITIMQLVPLQGFLDTYHQVLTSVPSLAPMLKKEEAQALKLLTANSLIPFPTVGYCANTY